VRYGDNASQNKAKKSTQGALEAKPEVEIKKASRFSDSATPTFDLTKSRPKYTTTSGFANPLHVSPRPARGTKYAPPYAFAAIEHTSKREGRGAYF